MNIVSKIKSYLKNLSTDTNGNIKGGLFRLVESAKGGVNYRHAEMTIKRVLDGARRQLALQGSSVSFIPFCEAVETCQDFNQLLGSPVVKTEKRKKAVFTVVTLDEKTRQQRIAAYSNRVKATFGEMFGFTTAQLKSVNIGVADLLEITKLAAAVYVRSTPRYADIQKAKVAAKAATKVVKKGTQKPVNANKLRKAVKNATSGRVVNA